jgi:hypothetical protein
MEGYETCPFCQAVYCEKCDYDKEFTFHLVTHLQSFHFDNDAEGCEEPADQSHHETLYITSDGTFVINDGGEEKQETLNQERVENEEQEINLMNYSASLQKIGSHGENTFDKLVLGVATWNVAHLGKAEKKLEHNLRTSLFSLERHAERFENKLNEMSDGFNKNSNKKRKVGAQSHEDIDLHDPNSEEGKTSRDQQKSVVSRKYREKELIPERDKTNATKEEIILGEAKLREFRARIDKVREMLNRVSTEDKREDVFFEDLPPLRGKIDTMISQVSRVIYNFEYDSKYHKILVINNVVQLFSTNPWLDILILQEVGEGIGKLEQEIKKVNKKSDLKLKCIRGPRMHSSSDEASLMQTQSQKGQHEYYPMIIREKDDIKLKYLWSWAIGSDGGVIDPIEIDDEFVIPWNKKAENPTYRPIMVHTIEVVNEIKGNKKVHIGVVHTTPGTVNGKKQDHEFNRKNEYDQLRSGLEKQVEEGEYWIIGGDYYLFDESRVTQPDPKNLTQTEKNNILIEFNKFRAEISKMEGSKVQRILSTKRGRQLMKLLNQLDTEEKDTEEKKLMWLINFYKSKQSFADIKKKTRVRVNREDSVRNVLRLTFEHNLPSYLKIAQPVSGTNWHGKEKLHNRLIDPIPQRDEIKRAMYYATARIADIFLHTKDWQKVRVGLMGPEGGVIAADTASLKYSKYWGEISDHFPVGGRFSTMKDDTEVDSIFVKSDTAELDKELLEELALLIKFARQNNRLPQEKVDEVYKANAKNRDRIFALREMLKNEYSEELESLSREILTPGIIDALNFEPENESLANLNPSIHPNPNNNSDPNISPSKMEEQ